MDASVCIVISLFESKLSAMVLPWAFFLSHSEYFYVSQIIETQHSILKVPSIRSILQLGLEYIFSDSSTYWVCIVILFYSAVSFILSGSLLFFQVNYRLYSFGIYSHPFACKYLTQIFNLVLSALNFIRVKFNTYFRARAKTLSIISSCSLGDFAAISKSSKYICTPLMLPKFCSFNYSGHI